MKILSFKTRFNILLLTCVLWTLLLDKADCSINVSSTTTTQKQTTPLTTLTTKSTPQNVANVTVVTQSEISITLTWKRVDNRSTYSLQYNDQTKLINASLETESVQYEVQNLSPATRYNFTLTTKCDGLSSSGYSFKAVTAPRNVANVTVEKQNETSITLRWKKADNNSKYILEYNDNKIQIDASSQGESVQYVVSSLTAAKKYNFTLISTFDNITSSGFSFNASTAPRNVANVTVVTQSETSITLTWKRVDNRSTYSLQYNDQTKLINASLETESVQYEVQNLSPASRYNFTLTTKCDGLSSSGYSFKAVTAPRNVANVTVEKQNETSITLRWKKADNNSKYILEYNDNKIQIDASSQGESVQYVVSSLTAAKKYNFTLISTFDNITSSGFSFNASTAPRNVVSVTVVTQTETSITLRWKKIDNSSTYILKYNDKVEEPSSAPEGNESVQYVVSSLTAAKKYNFTLISKFDNITSNGISFTAVTAPDRVKDVTVVKNETSITLRWNDTDSVSKYILILNDKGNGTEETVNASLQRKPVEHGVQNLTPATTYSFTLFAVFEGARSTGYNFTVGTPPLNVASVTVVTQTETSITLRWKKVDNSSTYILKYNDKVEEPSSAPEGNESVQYVVSSLTAATNYNFTLISKFNNITSSGFSFNASTAPPRVTNVMQVEQTETSVTLRWTKVDNVSTYILHNLNNGNYTLVEKPPVQNQSVTQKVPNLTAGTKYSFSLLSVFEGINSTAFEFTAATIPERVTNVTALTQNDSSITLRWEKSNRTPTYYLRYNSIQKLINESSEQTSIEYAVSPLNASTRYNFILFTLFEGFESKTGFELSTVTAPHSVRNVNVSTQTESSITLWWDGVDDISAYVLRYHNGSSEEEKKDINESQHTVQYEVTNLTAGTKYHFTLVAVFDTVSSAELKFTAVTAPINVNKVNVVKQTETNITLMWDKVNNIYNYSLLYGDSTVNNQINETSQSVTHMVSSLAPGKTHTFTLFTVFETVKSTGYTFTAATVPLRVSAVNVAERSESSITLSWETTDETWRYFVEHDGSGFSVTSDRSSNVVTQTIKPLKPGTKYEFKVITSFSGLNSTAYSVDTVTTINCAIVNWHITDSSIQGTVEGLFTNATATNHSKVNVSPVGSNVSFTGLYPGETYEIYLEYETTSERLLQCHHSLTIRPSVLLNPRCEYWAGGYSVNIAWDKPVGVWTAVEVNVKDKSSIVNKSDQHVIFDGFQPAKTYQVTLTTLSGSVRSLHPSVFPCYTDPRGVIGGSVFAVLLFGVLICAALFIFFKRPDIISRKKSFIGGSRLSNKKSKAISVAEFPDHFYQLNLDDKRGFSQEYENLAPVGRDQPQMTAVLPENKAKNRFTNVLPYDWCRVKLSTSSQTGTSDYINASYMPGYKSNKQYIATQGPLPSTVNDFWRMIWEQRVKGIVMVTNCVEGGRTKCEQYWPADSSPCRYGELLVTIRSEQKEPSWTLREFKVKHSNTSEERTVKHFHFTAWPDHNVPECTEVLIQFRRLVRQHIESEGGKTPTLVHCSAGVGRTGTIIALDVLLQQLDKEGAVGINAFVHQMRLNRPYMVQTESQYVFLHQCIMDCLKPKDKTDELIYENVDAIYVNATALRQLR